MSHASSRSARGVSLVEALVALGIMAFGMVAYVGVQNTLRLNGDVARQRSEATRLAQEAIDGLRLFTVVQSTAGQPAWDDVVEQPTRSIAGGNATYLLKRDVIVSANPAYKTLKVTVSWRDRNDQDQSVVLSSVLGAVPPGLSAGLAVAQTASPVRRVHSRHPTIPLLAKDLGGGRSVFSPAAGVAWVFDNVSGIITGVCQLAPEVKMESLTASGLADCSNNTVAQFVSGFVRFRLPPYSSLPLTAADSEDPPGPALNLDVQLVLTSSGHPGAAQCFDDAPLTKEAASQMRFVTYQCIVPANPTQLWSGRIDLVARAMDQGLDTGYTWRIGDTGEPNAYLVCRYTPASSDAQTVSNADHPSQYSLVAGNLTNQNFLVASFNCPTDVAANPANGDFANSNTLLHQPEPN